MGGGQEALLEILQWAVITGGYLSAYTSSECLAQRLGRAGCGISCLIHQWLSCEQRLGPKQISFVSTIVDGSYYRLLQWSFGNFSHSKFQGQKNQDENILAGSFLFHYYSQAFFCVKSLELTFHCEFCYCLPTHLHVYFLLPQTQRCGIEVFHK